MSRDPNLGLRAYIESDRQLDLYTPVYFIEADALQESFGSRLLWGRLPLSTQTNSPVLARVCLAPSLWLSATPAGVTSQYGTRPICCGNTTQQQTYRVVVIATNNIHFNISFTIHPTLPFFRVGLFLQQRHYLFPPNFPLPTWYLWRSPDSRESTVLS